MAVEIREEPPAALADYARVSIAFEVSERLIVLPAEAGPDGAQLFTERVAAPYLKDYDADPDHPPTA